MYRSEVEECWDISELLDCAYNLGMEELCGQYMNDDRKDEYIEENLDDFRDGLSWTELRDWLVDIPTGYDWYHVDYEYDRMEILGCGDYEIEDLRNLVLEEGDEQDAWENEDEDDDYYEENDEGQETHDYDCHDRVAYLRDNAPRIDDEIEQNSDFILQSLGVNPIKQKI